MTRTVTVTDQGNTCVAIGVVSDFFDHRFSAYAAALEVNLSITAFSATTAVSAGNASALVTTPGAHVRVDQGLIGSRRG
jgi:hypothetical protein